ncbi:MAG: hypothetical protein JRJ84_15980 [Deltaproteobacteria bacterium]|nr:hypothetical protein [Deltaproteobacteria bacterium]
MTRVVVSTLHTFLAATIILGGIALLLQAQLNARWEKGFYGELSLLTGAILVTSAVMIWVAVVQATSALGYAFGRRWGAWGLLMVSMLLVLASPSPLSWIIALAAGALLFELWLTRPRPPESDAA